MVSPYAESPVLSVSQTIELCNTLLHELNLQVEGEVANYTVSKGKFVFFDLKDPQTEARLGCFQMLFQQSFPLEDGMKIVVRAQAGIYAKSGQFRLTVSHMELRGEGSLKRAFELLKAKLEAEGLFAEGRKRALPRYPRTIGLISSTGAAGYGDFMRILEQRSNGIHIFLANVSVQGVEAEAEIIAALDYLNSYKSPEVIVLVRGGGSMEDLHAFNSEKVARAIARSKVPVIVGVGHERDITIADFVADVRASTPSNAAQLVVLESREVLQQVQASLERQHHAIRLRLQGMLHQATHIVQSLEYNLQEKLSTYRQESEKLLKSITALSPHHVLARGYTLTYDAKGRVLKSSQALKPGDTLTTAFADDTKVSHVITRS